MNIFYIVIGVVASCITIVSAIDTSNLREYLFDLHSFLISDIFNTYQFSIIIIVALSSIILFIRHNLNTNKSQTYKYREEQKNAIIEFHKLSHIFRDYMHQMILESDAAIKELKKVSNVKDLRILDEIMKDFNIEVARRIKKASRKTSNAVQQCVERTFNSRNLKETCSVGVLMIDKLEANEDNLDYSNMNVFPIALDRRTYDEIIYHWKRNTSKNLKSFKIKDSTPIQSIIDSKIRFINNDLRTYKEQNKNKIPIECIEEICKANAMMIAPIHSIDVQSGSFISFGFISMFSKNCSNNILYDDDKNTEIYHQISLCADTLSSLFMLSLVLKKKVQSVYRLQIEMIEKTIH